MAGTDQVCRPLAAAGTGPPELAALTLGDAAVTRAGAAAAAPGRTGIARGRRRPAADRPSDRRAAEHAGAVPLHLRRAHTTRIGIEANAGICRGMLRHRYGTSGLGEEEQ